MEEHKFIIRQVGTKIVLVIDGHGVEIPWQDALRVAAGIRRKAQLAQEEENAQMIIADQALLHKVGAPFGLSSNPKILKEAIKESEKLKVTGAISSQSIVGAPTIRQYPPNSAPPPAET